MIALSEPVYESQESLMARSTADGIHRSLGRYLLLQRIPSCVREVRVARTGDPVPLEPNAWEVFITLAKKSRQSKGSYPAILRILCFYDNVIMILVPGMAAREFSREQAALVTQKAREVILF